MKKVEQDKPKEETETKLNPKDVSLTIIWKDEDGTLEIQNNGDSKSMDLIAVIELAKAQIIKKMSGGGGLLDLLRGAQKAG